MDSAVDYAASRLYAGLVEAGRKGGRTVQVDRAPVFDLGQGAPVPDLRRPLRADSLAAFQATIEQCHVLNTAAALIVRICDDNNLPVNPRGIDAARFAVGDLLHNIEEAIRAHQNVMARG